MPPNGEGKGREGSTGFATMPSLSSIYSSALKPAYKASAQPAPSSSAAASKFQVPDPLSLNGILRQHSRTRLYVTPLCWTTDQLDHLKCRFERNAASRATGPREDPMPPGAGTAVAQGQQQQTASGAAAPAKTLRQTYNAEVKRQAVQQLLNCHGFRPIAMRLWFRFGNRVADELPVDGLFAPSPLSPPSLALLDMENLSARRSAYYRRPRRERPNAPFASLRRKRLKRITPPDEREDPFIAAVLIALAQERRQAAQRRQLARFATVPRPPLTSPPPATYTKDEVRPVASAPCFPVHVLAINPGKGSLYLYAAHVPSAYLDKLATPSRFVASEPLAITYRQLTVADGQDNYNSLARALKEMQGSARY